MVSDYKHILFLIVFIGLTIQSKPSIAQIKLGEHTTLTGRIGLDMSYYNRFNAPTSREKYRVRFYAQPYLKIKEWDIKFNFLVGSYHKKFQQEFNKFGTSISHNFFDIHLGHHNLYLSPFTLNGHTILGGGLELQPGKFRFSASYGRFRRDINPSQFTTTDFILPSYNRFGLAGKIGVGTENNFLDLNVLSVSDNASSLSSTAAGFILPQDNAVISINTHQKIFKQKLVFEGEFAISAYTNNNTSTVDDSSEFEIAKIAGYLLKRNATTEYSKAIRSALAYNNSNRRKNDHVISKMNGFRIKLVYERIDPNYRSMGTYYLRNDLQRIRLTSQLAFKQNKLILSPQIGYENNDLEKSSITQNKRIIGGLQANVRIKHKTFINLGYMNFNSALENNTNDSLVLRKVTHNTVFGFTNRHAIKGKKNMLKLNFSYQTGINKTHDSNANFLGNIGARASYLFTAINQKLSIEPSFRVNTYKRILGGNQARITPSISTKSKFLDNKMSLNYDFATIIVRTNGIGISNTAIRNQVRWRYQFHKKQSISFNCRHQQNLFKNSINYGDLQLDVRYSVRL